MTNTRFMSDYRRARNEGKPAKFAWALAKAWETERNYPLGNGVDEYETEDGFIVKLRIEGDDGDFGDTYGEIERNPYGYQYPRNGHDGWYLSEYRRYVPNGSWTFQERWDYLAKTMARHDAYLAALESLREEAEEFERMTCHDRYAGFVWAQVTAYRKDEDGDLVEYGEDSLGGIWSDDLVGSMCNYDMVADALSIARDAWNDELADQAIDIEATRPDMYEH